MFSVLVLNLLQFCEHLEELFQNGVTILERLRLLKNIFSIFSQATLWFKREAMDANSTQFCCTHLSQEDQQMGDSCRKTLFF